MVTVALVAAGLVLMIVMQGYRDQLTMDRLSDLSSPLNVQVRHLVRENTPHAEINRQLKEQLAETKVRALLLRADGLVLEDSSDEPGMRGQNVELPEDLSPNTRTMLNGRLSQPGKLSLLYIVSSVHCAKASPEQATYLLVAQPDQIWGTVAVLVPRLTVAALVAFLVAFVVAGVGAGHVYGPIGRLRAAAEAMQRGDYNQKVEIERPREVAELGASFNRMTEEVRRSRQWMRDFVADVSHELKTPLTSIRGFAQAIADGVTRDEESQRAALAIIDSEARRLQGLVAQLLDYSRIEAGQTPMTLTPVELNELVASCLEIFEPHAREKSVTLRNEVDRRFVLLLDADRIEQLLVNLIDNAISHSPVGGTVTVAAEAGQQEVLLSVADNGAGMSEEDRERVFERFYTGCGGKHSGLGLAIARQIARSHGGELTVDSRPGEGARFVVRLPWNDATA